jgi:hypothetical protein
VWVFLFAGTVMLSACGGGSSSSGDNSSSTGTVAGNWQFTVANAPDQSFVGGIQSGFLLQKKAAVTGSVVYTVALPIEGGGTPTVCNSGSAPITGTVSGQNVTLTAVAGSQTFTFTGTLSSDGSMMSGTYASTADTSSSGCGTAQTGLAWSAKSVPPLTGNFQGTFHSTGFMLGDQVFAVTGSLTQGENFGASNATVTGNMSFLDPVSLVSDYPCLDIASLTGQISGNSVILQIVGFNGLNAGQIGIQASQVNMGGSGAYPVTYDSTPNGYVLHSVGQGYVVNTKACPTNASVNFEDFGDICLALSGSAACQQPVTLSPGFITFAPQLLGSAPTTQTIKVAYSDPSGATLNGLSLQWAVESGTGSQTGQTAFTGQPNFTLADTNDSDPCAVPAGSTFSLGPGQSCTFAVSFAPQESCSWLPIEGGTPPAQCPLSLFATFTINSPSSADNITSFRVPINGTGLSALTPSTAELDFGASAIGEGSLPQILSFTNRSDHPVQILPSAPCVNASFDQFHPLPHPLMLGSPVAGLQTVSDLRQDTNNSTIDYSCDSDPATPNLPNFQITADTCSGMLIAPAGSCSLQIALVPQSLYPQLNGFDYFLELNTVQCTSADNPNSSCEIDGGRFPVELRANPPSQLRMSPGAGLDFGNQAMGKGSATQAITIFNDPNDPNPGTVNFLGKFAVKGDYSETDDCPFSLAPGDSCTVTISFKPKILGQDPGTITIATNNPLVQTIYLRGTGQ